MAPGLIESGWRGESAGFVNDIFGGRAVHPLEYYLSSWRPLWPGLLLNWLALGALVVLLARPETWGLARRAFGTTGPEVLHATPKLMICVVLLSLGVSECYPLSQFAMYSNFASEGGYLLVTDGADEPIPTGTRAGIRLDAVKKIFQTNLLEERELRGVTEWVWYLGWPEPKNEVVEAAAVRTLRYLSP